MRKFFMALSFGAPGLAQLLVERFFFTPATYVPSADEKRRLEQGEQFHVRVHGRRIRRWRWGNGPGVLLVHGWSGRGIQLSRYIDPLVRAGNAAIAIDGPAHGDSEALCGRIGHVTLKTTSGLGHRKIMSDPDVVEAGVLHLLQDLCDAPADGTFGERGTAPSSPLRGIGRERHAAR